MQISGEPIKEIEKTTLIDFSAKFVEGKTYLKWIVETETEDGLFMVERSANNKDFDIIGLKRGIGVPISQPILYCATDKDPLPGISYYRLIKAYKVGKRGDWRYWHREVLEMLDDTKGRQLQP